MNRIEKQLKTTTFLYPFCKQEAEEGTNISYEKYPINPNPPWKRLSKISSKQIIPFGERRRSIK